MSSKDQERNRIVVICELNKTHLKNSCKRFLLRHWKKVNCIDVLTLLSAGFPVSCLGGVCLSLET